MEHGQTPDDVKVVTSAEYGAWYRKRLANNDPTLKHEPFWCQKCGRVDVNIPGNQIIRWRLCGHRCCKYCMDVDSRSGQMLSLCPLCNAYPSAEEKRNDCITCLLLATLISGAVVWRIAL